MRLVGYRKIIIFLVSVGALVFGLHLAIDAIREIETEKATQLAVIVGGFFTALGGLVGAIVAAFRGTYARDAAIAACKTEK